MQYSAIASSSMAHHVGSWAGGQKTARTGAFCARGMAGGLRRPIPGEMFDRGPWVSDACRFENASDAARWYRRCRFGSLRKHVVEKALTKLGHILVGHRTLRSSRSKS